jgi:hypothetical protein
MGCDPSRLPHFIDNRLKDSGEIICLKIRPAFSPMKIPGNRLC